MGWLRSGWLLLMPGLAWGSVAPECVGLPRPDNYNEQVQQDFQANYFALVSSLSPLHGGVPNRPGRGSIGLDVGVIPPLGCSRRYVLDWTKTEDTNKSPILPRIRAMFSFPAIAKKVVPYAGVAVLPPVPVGGTRNLVVSAEGGVGVLAHEHVEPGVRMHTSIMRTYGDIATAFNPDDPAIDDVYVGATWGIDAIVGFPVEVDETRLTPYISAGYLDASTFFLVGDSRFVANNFHPYAGFTGSVGLDALVWDRFRVAGEFFAAPGGYSKPDPSVASVTPAARYGHLFTARIFLGVEL